MRHGKSEEQHLFFKSFLRVEALQETSRRVRSKLCRPSGKSQEDIGWTEALCKDMDEKAQEDHTCTLTKAERLRYKSNWRLAQNSSGKNGGSFGFSTCFPRSSRIKRSLVQRIGRLSAATSTSRSRSIAERQTSSLKLVVKVLELIKQLGGHFGRLHHLLQLCGRATDGTGKNTTPHKARQLLVFPG